MLQNSIIRKDNFLIMASYKLTLVEQRLVLCAIGKIPYKPAIKQKTRPEDNDQKTVVRKKQKINRCVEVTVKEYLQCFPDAGEQHVYQQLKEAVENLWTRGIRIEGSKQKTDFRWISAKTIFLEDPPRVGFAFSPEIIPYLEELLEKFTMYQLRDIAHFTSIYAIRLYEMMMQFKSTGLLKIEVNILKERLGILDKYNDYPNFRRKVIEVALKEINQKTLYNITCMPIRQGRAIKMLVFRFYDRQK